MSEHAQRVRGVTNGNVTTKTTRIIDDNSVNPTQNQQSLIIVQGVWFVTGVLLVLLTFRFVLVLLGANPTNGFTNFIYAISLPFASPFFGIFGYSIKYSVSRVELSTLVAMAVYALIALGISKLLTLGRSSNA